jgi:deoxyadenosine/deoxycytidine kinase
MRIALEGNIGSGKSTVIEALSAKYPNVPMIPEPIEKWGDLLDLFYANPGTWALPFSLKVLLTFREAGTYQTCVSERCPLSCRHVFTHMLANDGTLSQNSYDIFKEFYDILAWTPDVIVYIDTPIATCLERITQRGRESEVQGIDIHYLRRIQFSYETMLKFIGKDITVIRINGDRCAEDILAEVESVVSQYV